MANELLSKTVTISYGGQAIAKLTGWSLEVNKETVDITNFDSPNAFKEFLVDLKEWTISFDGIVTRTSATDGDYQEILESIISSDAVVAITIADSALTGGDITGNAFFTGVSLSGSLGDKQTQSGSLQGTSTLSVASVT
jgi:predicted secreted protein